MRAGEAGVDLDRAAIERLRLVEAGRGERPEVPQPALVAIPGIEIAGRLAGRELLLDPRQFRLDRRRDLARHLLLDVEDVLELQVVGLGPELGAVGGAHQLGGDADTRRLALRTLPTST